MKIRALSLCLLLEATDCQEKEHNDRRTKGERVPCVWVWERVCVACVWKSVNECVWRGWGKRARLLRWMSLCLLAYLTRKKRAKRWIRLISLSLSLTHTHTYTHTHTFSLSLQPLPLLLAYFGKNAFKIKAFKDENLSFGGWVISFCFSRKKEYSREAVIQLLSFRANCDSSLIALDCQPWEVRWSNILMVQGSLPDRIKDMIELYLTYLVIHFLVSV